MTTTDQKPEPTSKRRGPEPKPPRRPAVVTVEHTFTPPHTFQLRDELASAIDRYAPHLPHDTRVRIAEGLLIDRLADLMELNRLALAAGPRETHPAEACRDGSCDGPLIHVHGEQCGPLCACGEGR